MIEFFVKRPVTTVMFIMIFVVLGIVSFSNLSVEEMPKVEFPIVSVSVTYPGATPYEVETQVVKKIEEEVSEISEIKKIKSNCYDGLGVVLIEFLLEANVNFKSIEVKDKVEAIINDFPEGAEQPIIEKYDPLVQPVIDLVLYSDLMSGKEVYEYADKQFKNKISTVSGVASIDIYGGMERQINVKLDPVLMKQYYITIDDVVDRIKAKNQNVPGGSLDKDEYSLSVRFQGEFVSVDDIANMVLTSEDGSQFYLKDIATIEDGYKKIDTIARFNGKDVVNLSIKKVSDGNAVDVASGILAKLPELRESLPEGMHLEVAADTTEFIVMETKDAQKNIMIGVFLTALILFLFTGQAKLTFISSIVIPTSVISTFFLMDKNGFTINVMTLLAVATSLGTLIANAIVIIEHVLEFLEEGQDSVSAAINGTKRCTFAVLAAAGTNLVVFTPIAFMGGMIGQFFKSFGLTVVFATIFSLVASFSLTPMLCGIFLRNYHEKKRPQLWNPFYLAHKVTDNFVKFLRKEYLYLFNVIFRFPKTALLIAVLMIWSLKFIFPFLGNEFYPNSDQGKITVDVTMPQGSTIDRTSEVCREIEKHLEGIPEVCSVLTYVGENGVENGALTVNLLPVTERKRSDVDLINDLIPYAASISDAEVEFKQTGGPEEADITINVYGIDYTQMVEYSIEMKKIMEESGFLRSVISSHKYPKTEIQFLPDQSKLAEYDVDNALLGRVLRASVYGDDSNIYKEAGEEYDINVELDTQYKNTLLDVYDINVISRKGMIPITELGRIKEQKALPMIKHRDKQRIIQLECYLAKSTSGHVQQFLNKKFTEIGFKKGYGYNYVGSQEMQDESNAEIGKAFILAVVLTFMLLAAIMNSYMYPLAILNTVATSMIGIFLGLFFFEYSVNIASLLGIVMLVGLVVNDAILMVEYSIHKMGQGLNPREAVLAAVSDKFRPILMTSTAIMSGTLPQMWALMPLKSSMAVVIIGGMIAATVFTFLVVPLVFWYIERLRRFTFKLFKKKEVKAI